MRAAIVLLAWGVWLALLTAAQAPFGPRWMVPVMLAGASAACLLTGGALWVLEVRARHAGQADQRLITNSSYAVMTLTVGASLALIGSGFGLWLILLGAGVAALGAGGLVRETLGRRRALRGRSVR